MMPLVAMGRHLSREANGPPSMPRRSSNWRQNVSADVPGVQTIMAQIHNLRGFFSHTGVLDSKLKRLAQIEIFCVVIKSAPR
jgi:hypothetical protein